MEIRILLLTLTFILCFGCTMDQTSDQSLDDFIVKANDELFNKGNIEYVDQIFSPEYNGTGPAQIKSFLSELRTAIPDIQVKVEPVLSEGQLVGWQRSHTGTHQGQWKEVHLHISKASS